VQSSSEAAIAVVKKVDSSAPTMERSRHRDITALRWPQTVIIEARAKARPMG
jgi:hypothetical protein